MRRIFLRAAILLSALASCALVSCAPPKADPGHGAPPGTSSYTPRLPAPALDGGPAVPGQNWFNGDPAVMRDSVGGDLVGFFAGDHSLLAVVSRDGGRSWVTIRPASDVALPACDALCQGPDGMAHIAGSVAWGAFYGRMRLQRGEDGHVTGFASDIPASSDCRIELPFVNSIDYARWSIIAATDAAGSPRILVAAYCGKDDPGEGVPGRIKAAASSPAAGASPMNSSDWGPIDGAPSGGCTIVYSASGETATPHSTGMHMVQHPLSKDLWFEWGPLDTFHDSVADHDPVQRLRATPLGGRAWSPGQPVLVESYSTRESYECQHFCMCVTGNYVWSARLDPEEGLTIDRIDRDGAVLAEAIPRPASFSGPGLGACAVLSVAEDESRAWLGAWLSEDSRADAFAFFAGYWDGGSWTIFEDEDLADSYGLGRSVGWGGGLVLVTADPYSRAVSLAAVRTE